MELLKTTKSGTTYYMLKDGRLGAIYPDTGYARVSFSMKGFLKPEYREAQIKRNRDAVANNTIGKMMKYQINPVRMVTEFKEIDTPLYYKFFGKEMTWHKAYYKMESKERIKYPGDFSKLYNMLLAFETKNCNTNV